MLTKYRQAFRYVRDARAFENPVSWRPIDLPNSDHLVARITKRAEKDGKRAAPGKPVASLSTPTVKP